MTTHRRYTFATDLEEGHQGAAKVVQRACEMNWWYDEPEVSSDGKLTIKFLARGRDQWWVHRRAMDLALNAVYAAGGRERDVPIPTWEKLPPHEERGYGLLM